MLHEHTFILNNDLSGRFHYLLSNGAFNHLTGTGLIESAVSKIARGNYPDGDFVGKMGSYASQHWLFYGEGVPFNVYHFSNDAEAADYLGELLAEDFRIYIVRSEQSHHKWLLYCFLPTCKHFDHRWLPYRETIVISGDLGSLTLEQAQKPKTRTSKIPHIEVDQEEFELLQQGWRNINE